MNLDRWKIEFIAMSVFLIFWASSIVFPLSHSVARLELAIAEPQPNVAQAQARVAAVVRESGYEVVSSGVAANEVRATLDRKDLASIRRSGIGYVILGTANVSLEERTAYGSIYHVASASASFELVRMSDGAIAATGSGDAKSRGSANVAAAISEALLTAASDAARSLMRQFQP